MLLACAVLFAGDQSCLEACGWWVGVVCDTDFVDISEDFFSIFLISALFPIHHLLWLHWFRPVFPYAVLGWFSLNNQLCSVCVACSVVCSCCYVVWYFLDLNWSVMNFLVLPIRLICMVTHLNYSWIWMLRASSFVIYYLDSSFSPLCESRNEPMWVLDILGNAFTFWATSCVHFVLCWAYEC